MYSVTSELDNTIYIGNKPTRTYVFSVQTQAQLNPLINIRARGRSISKAVDVCLISTERFLQNWIKKNVEIGTEIKKNDDLIDRVSYIHIIIAKVSL